MSIEVLTILMLAGTMALLAIGLPFAFTTGLIACVFALSLFGLPGLTLVSSRTYSFMNEFVLASVPMFILMASILERSGVATICSTPCTCGRAAFRAAWAWPPC